MKQKGFSLIELLVVVVIIAILVAIGLIAYNGYTKGAKTAAIKSNHSQMCNFITAEVTKCLLSSSTAMDGNLDCSKKDDTDYDEHIKAAALKSNLKKIKNPITSSVGGNLSGHEALKYGPYALIDMSANGVSPNEMDSYGYNIIATWPNDPVNYKNNCCHVFIQTCHTVKHIKNGQIMYSCDQNFANGGIMDVTGKHSENWSECAIPLR